MNVPVKVSSVQSKHVVRQQMTDPRSGAQIDLDLSPDQAIALADLLVKAAQFLRRSQ